MLANEAIDVVAEIEGRLREVRVQPGDRVEVGTVLVSLDNDSLAHQLTVESEQEPRLGYFTKDSAGGNDPSGKTAKRSPARSLAEASRYSAMNSA